MFKPASMKKVDILVLGDNVDEITESLGRMAAIQLTDVKPGADEIGLREVDVADRIELWNGIEQTALAICRLLGVPEKVGTPPTPKDWTAEKLTARLEEIQARVKDIVSFRTSLEERLRRLKEVQSEVESFVLIDTAIERINDFSFLHFAVGSLSDPALKRLQKRQVDEDALLIPFKTASGEPKVVAITAKKKRWGLESDLREVGFEKEDISEKYKGIPVEILRDAQEQYVKAAGDIEEAERKVCELRDERSEELLAAIARARLEKKVLEAKEHFAKTENIFLISGWVPADRMKDLEKKVQEMTRGQALIKAHDPSSLKEVKEGRMAVPVLLSNPMVLKPFERIITTYGFPSYNEIEPTLFVALSFLLMFGLMFGDLGQGLLIAIGGLAMLKIPALHKRFGDLGMLLIGAGLSGAVFGLLYGSVFASENIIRPLWKNPMKEIMAFFEIGISIGIGMILLGLVINIVNCLKRRDLLHGVFDRLGIVGAIFYVGCVGVGIKHLVLERTDVNTAQIALFIVLPLIILFFREPIYNILTHRPGLIHGDVGTYLMESLVEVMETLISFLANTVSFIRVSAFALSHVGLSIAIFALAAAIHEASGSTWLSVAAVVLGNALIIALEGLIVTIQTIRLEYYEFFSKFFGGTGEKFEPFFISR